MFGFESWTFLIVTICVVGIAAGATAVLAPDPPTLRWFVALLVGPAILMDVFVGGQRGFALAGMLVLHLWAVLPSPALRGRAPCTRACST